ncbi:MAG: efflux RND transporter periplasmic adaptor subunit, partial [Planctomycetota bacterium]
PVQFTVDAYPDEVFDSGVIEEIRLSSQVNQNVVTYPVVVATPNPEGKLLPGMTASLSFRIEHHPDVIKIPNAALRFYPPDRKKVHPDDRAILDGVELTRQESESQSGGSMSALERAAASRQKTVRHVWYFDGEFLRAKQVTVGLSDSRYTELIDGDVAPGDRLVTGEMPKQ